LKGSGFSEGYGLQPVHDLIQSKRGLSPCGNIGALSIGSVGPK
jgi:hypothetical protein